MAGGADLETVCERLAWACQHLRHLNVLMEPVRQALREETNRAFQIKREQGGEVRLYSVSYVPPVPPDVSLVIGDCLHNLRGTLDNLIFVVGSDNTPGGLSIEQERASAFPISDTREGFREPRSKRSIAALPVRAQAAVQRLQPYKSHDPLGHPLTILTKLANLDKHRFVPVVTGTVQTVGHVIGRGGNYPLEFLSHRLEPNADFLQVTVPPNEANMDVQLFFSLCISLEEPDDARGRDAWYWLNDARRSVIDIVAALAPYCAGVVAPDMAHRWQVADPAFGANTWVSITG